MAGWSPARGGGGGVARHHLSPAQPRGNAPPLHPPCDGKAIRTKTDSVLIYLLRCEVVSPALWLGGGANIKANIRTEHHVEARCRATSTSRPLRLQSAHIAALHASRNLFIIPLSPQGPSLRFRRRTALQRRERDRRG